jgi:P pilus assembly chaperone PapD
MKHAYRILIMALVCAASGAHATGVVPETSVVIVNEADGEGSINVKNTDPGPVLLYSSLKDVPEDSAHLLIVTPPVARVDGGKSQLVRFIMDNAEPLKTERFKRVVFEGIPSTEKGKNKVQVTIRQDLPVIIHPRDLDPNREPWTLLKWSRAKDKLTVSNDSAYVVRLDQKIQLEPNDTKLQISKTYILPGEHIEVPVTDGSALAAATKVRLFPATVYGYAVASYDAPLVAASPAL